MSEETNDMISDDAAMDASEFEISETVHITTEIHITHSTMSSEEFEVKLIEFFTKYKKSKLRLVSRIVFEFKGYEGIVLEYLNKKYVLGTVAEKPKGKIAHKSGEHDEHSKNIESSNDEKPKSKKTMVIIIIVVVLAALGVTGFLMKDKIMGTAGKGPSTEKEAPTVKAGETPVIATKPKEEVAPKVEATDSTKTATTDSTKTK